jgi:hypothetical protein
MAGDRTLFPSASLEAVAGRQLLVAAGRTRALVIESPPAIAPTWDLTQTDAWAGTQERLTCRIAVKPGQPVWFSSAPVPSHHGPVRFGLYRRRLFRPEGSPAAIGELSDDRLTAEAGATLTLSRPAAEVVKGGVLLAGLYPVFPDDPIEATEHVQWFARLDRVAHRLLPVSLMGDPAGKEWTLRPMARTAPGVYRLRVWVVPKDVPRPEGLGGPKGAAVGYFPGFEGRGTTTSQPFPVGDVLMTVAGPGTGSLAVVHPGARTAFRRGEPIVLDLQARAEAKSVRAAVEVRRTDSDQVIGTASFDIALVAGYGVAGLAVPTEKLPPGRYRVSASTAGLSAYPYEFSVAPPAASGMPVLNSPLHGPADLEAHQRLGVTGWVDVMPPTSGLIPVPPRPSPTSRGLYSRDRSLPAEAPMAPPIADRLTAGNWVFLQGIQSRQISFGLHYGVPEHEAETIRKHLIDYDLGGTGAGLGYSPEYIKAGNRRVAALAERREKAWAEARKAGAGEAERTRFQTHFHAGVIADLYSRSVAALHRAVPDQRHTSAVTADHAYLQDGQYLPDVYRPLDFRYLECWNDQIYPNGAHDLQECFWTALLRAGKPAGQPVWVTVPGAPQPGTHFRRTLDAAARGANATGYNAEGGAGLTGGWGAEALRSEARTAQEALTGDLARRYGTWLNRFEPAEGIGILDSASQGGTNFGQSSPIFFAFYTLARLNRPARLVTEEEIAAGGLKGLAALLVVRQTAPLPAAAVGAIEAFAAGGGKVLCDRDTTVTFRGAVRLEGVSWPAGLWPIGGNRFHETIREFPERLGPSLRAALGDAGRQPVEGDGSVLIAAKRAPLGARGCTMTRPGARGCTMMETELVVVSGQRYYPFDRIFTPEERVSAFYRQFEWRSGVLYKDVVLPGRVTLTLRPDVAARRPHVHDVFAGKEVTIGEGGRLDLDLAALPARVLLITDREIHAPKIMVGRRDPADSRATLVVRSPVPVPVRIRVRLGARGCTISERQEFYRAATPDGSCDSVAVGPAAGEVPIEVTELVTGRTVRTALSLSKAVTVPVEPLARVRVEAAERVRAVLKAKNLAMYVDARQAHRLPAARRLAEKLGAEVVFNPPIADYPVSWDRPAEQEKAVADLIRTAAPARRRLVGHYDQWTGALAPAFVWNRPVVLFGHAAENRFLADLDAVGLPGRRASRESSCTLVHPGEAIGPGRAFVEPVASPFWADADAVLVLAADKAGLDAGFTAVTDVAAGRAVPAEPVSGAPGAEQRRRFGLDPVEYPTDLVPLEGRESRELVGLSPILPVTGVAVLTDGGAVVALRSPGRNLVRLTAEGREAQREVTAGFYQPETFLAAPSGESLVGDGTFAWRNGADGRLLWKMLGRPESAPNAAGTVWVSDGRRLVRVGRDGTVSADLTLSGDLLAVAPGGERAFLRRPGPSPVARSGATLLAIDLPSGKERWAVSNLDAAEVRVSADRTTIACIEHEDLARRDDLDGPDASRLTILDAATGRIKMSRPLGVSLSGPVLSPDGSRVVVSQSGYSDVLFVADVASGVVRRAVLPGRGVWSKAFTLDGSAVWVGADRLYRLDWADLRATPTLDRWVVTLSARSEGGVLAGTAEGTVVWLDRNGRTERMTSLADGIGVSDPDRFPAIFRDVRLVESARLRPHVPPAVIPLAAEYEIEYMVQGDAVRPRGDGILPVRVGIRVPATGRYRLTVELGNPPGQVGVGTLAFAVAGKDLVVAGPPTGKPLKVTAEATLTPGVHSLALVPREWKVEPVLKTLTISPVGSEKKP